MWKIIWSLFKCSLKYAQPLTDVLQDLNQHQLSVFLRTIYSIPKRATSLIYIQNGMILTFWCTKWHGSHLTACAKKHKKLWKSWKGNTALTIYVSSMQCKFVTVLSITSNLFWETEVEILGLGCERKHDLIHRWKVNKAYKFVLYMSKQSINFKNAETSWFRGLFLHFHTKKIISVHQQMAFATITWFSLL